jgi:hypothetical protein
MKTFEISTDAKMRAMAANRLRNELAELLRELRLQFYSYDGNAESEVRLRVMSTLVPYRGYIVPNSVVVKVSFTAARDLDIEIYDPQNKEWELR